MNEWYKRDCDTVFMNIYVQPGAKRTEIIGFYGTLLKIRLMSPPTDGRANKSLLNFMAELFSVPRCQVVLIRGGKSRHKQVAVIGSNIEHLIQLNRLFATTSGSNDLD
jgi:uncharacterized protein (TIGR00251 family)